MAISVVQKAGLGQSSSSSSQGSGAFGSNTTAGNTLIGIAVAGTGSTPNRTVSSVTGGGTFQLAIHAIVTNVSAEWGDIWVYFAPSISGGTTTGVTFNLSGTVGDLDVGCLEVSGVNSLDQTNHNDNVLLTGTTTMTTGSITPGQAASLVVAVAQSGGAVTWGTEPTGFTNQFQDNGATFSPCSVDTQILSSSSAQNPSYAITETGGNTGGCACIVSFIQSGGSYVPQPLKIFNSNQMPLTPYTSPNPSIPMLAPPVGQKKIFLPTPKEVRTVAASIRKAA